MLLPLSQLKLFPRLLNKNLGTFFAGITWFRSPNQDFLTGIVIRAPILG